ncbi:MAG: VCBS repeat-containing protein [Bacteriovorax sp.]|nr:VCBS repeat-containing protein [Bacteriovorax sp.]
MILSIFNKKSLVSNILLASFLASCSHQKKISSTALIQPLREEAPKYLMGPEVPSKIFVDKTEEYGLKDVQAVHLYAVDVNRDGYTDLVTLEDFYSAPKFYFFNPTTRKFVLGPSPFDSLVRGSYLNFVDLDHDGIYDVIVGTLNQKTEMTQYPARIFKGIIENKVLHYKEQSPLPTGLLPTASIVALDFDLDGELDLFLSNWFSYKDKNPKPVPDLLLKGSGFNFTDNSNSLRGEYDYNKTDKVYTNATPTFGASVCDVDKNGFPDILTSSSNGYYNKLWLNLEGKNFVNYGAESGYAADEDGSPETHGGGNSFFSLCGDYNNDGIIDIVVGNMSRDSDPESRDKSSVLSGTSKTFPPKFIRSEFLHAAQKTKWSEGDHRGVWIDYNLDGLSDLIIDNSGFPPDSRLVFFEQASDHAFEDKSRELGINVMNPSGTVTIDVNQDGVMDFITGQSKIRAGDINNRIYLFENQTKREGRGSVRFHLQAKNSNYHGISSDMWLTSNKQTRFFNVEYNSGSLPSQNEEGAYFAFDKETPKYVGVRWSYAVTDRLNRLVPVVKKYNLTKLKLKGLHTELNLCEDGRILPRKKNCY